MSALRSLLPEVRQNGHAIEVRLYAEDPANDFRPSTGTITRWELHEHGDVRVDAAVAEGCEVTPYYDPMLAKVVAHGVERGAAAAALTEALRADRVAGVVTNAESLVAILESEAFLSGSTTTAFLDENPELLAPVAPADVLHRHLVAAACLLLGGLRTDDAAPPRGWRNVAAAPETLLLRYRSGGAEHVAQVARAWTRDGGTLWVAPSVEGSPAPAQTVAHDDRFVRVEGAVLDKAGPFSGDDLWFGDEEGRLELDGVRRTVRVDVGDEVALSTLDGVAAVAPDALTVTDGGWSTAFEVVEPWSASAHDSAGGGPTTPVPGTVTHVAVAVGDAVEAGAALVVLEAMKMEHTIRADADGVVTEIHVTVGQSVDAHTVVATLEAGAQS